jgi:hypothetical protein
MTLGDLKTSVKHLSLGDCLLERWRLDENPSQEGFFFGELPSKNLSQIPLSATSK